MAEITAQKFSRTQNLRPEPMIDRIFNLCVVFLLVLAKYLRMTYEEVNVWIFCVLWPIITIILFGMVIYLW